MVEDSWENYRRHIEARLSDLEKLEDKVAELQVKFAILKTQATLLSAIVGFVMSIVGPFIMRRMGGGQ